MIGERVEHPQFGCGTVVAVFRSGSEWLVRFDSGLRFRKSRREFEGQAELEPVTPAFAPAPTSRVPMPQTQLVAQRLIEALRFGVAPSADVLDLTMGMAVERNSVIAALNRSHEAGGAVRAVLGEYGYGKSHLVELSAQEALARGFLVASASLDLHELPPHRAFDIYRESLCNLRTPNDDERGLGPLLARAERTGSIATMRESAKLEIDPLLLTLEVLADISSRRQRRAWQSWLMGGRRSRLMNRATPKGIKFPTIYRVGHNARQVAYLLSGVSVLARLAGYSGLCVLIDEAESYSLLTAQQRPKAGLFFAAMIHAAGSRRQALSEDVLPQHHLRDYPATYGAGQSLFFLFATTRSENRLPLEDWLAPDEILDLDPHPSSQEVGEYLQRVQGLHARAYSYQPGERQDRARRAAAEHLSLAMEQGRLRRRLGSTWTVGGEGGRPIRHEKLPQQSNRAYE